MKTILSALYHIYIKAFLLIIQCDFPPAHLLCTLNSVYIIGFPEIGQS